MQTTETFDRTSTASIPEGPDDRDPPTAIGEGAAVDVRRAFEDVTDSVEQLYRIGDRYLERQARQRPYVVLGAAAGLGFVLGGGLASRLTASLVSYGSRLAILSGVRAFMHYAERADSGPSLTMK